MAQHCSLIVAIAFLLVAIAAFAMTLSTHPVVLGIVATGVV